MNWCYVILQIPKKAILKFGINKATSLPLNFPCVILENVYVFPGSPVFLKTGFGSLYKVSKIYWKLVVIFH